MKATIILAATAAALVSAPAHAESYGKIFGGAVFGTEHDFITQGPGSGVIAGDYDTDLGFAIGGAYGREVSRFLSVEGEVAYRSNEIAAPAAIFGGDNDLNALSFMANGVLSAPGATGLAPYAGVGAGAVRLAAADDADLVFAYQAFGGVRKDISQNLSAGVEYRYLDAGEATFNNPAGFIETEYDSHSINLVLSHRF